jgi:putative chitinase
MSKDSTMFEFDFTPEKLAKCVKRNKNPNELYDALVNVLPRYEITTVERVAAFLAQCGHESADFTILQENLNYSAKGLAATWPKRFVSEAAAAPYNRNPEKIANKVYADRMGNGPEGSGDGWKYRGRGAIQLTGHDNYKSFADDVGLSIDDAIVYVESLDGAVESAAWFWWRNNLNQWVDKNDIVTLSKRINGGTLGLQERVDHYNHNVQYLAG